MGRQITVSENALPKNDSPKQAVGLDRLAALRRVVMFKGLPDTILAEIARAGCEQTLAKGEILFTEGERSPGLIVVLAGAVKAYKLDSRGRELTLDRELPGECVGELPLFDGGNAPASAEAAEEGTKILVISRARFQKLMMVYPQISKGALRAMAIRTRRLMQMLEAQALHSVRARCAAYLLHSSGGATAFALRETNEAIAGEIGTVREVVSRTLHSLRETGAISLNGRTITIRDAERLRRIAEGNA